MMYSGFPLKRAQLGLLGGDARGAAIQVAHAHHHTAHGYQRGGGKAELLRAQHGGDRHVAPGHELAVRFQNDAAAQVVEHQGLLCFGKAQLPGQARVLNGGTRARARAAVVPADEDDVRVALGNARGDGANARLRYQLHADARLAVGVAQVINQLGQILDGIDIMMWRRVDEANARRAAGRPRRAWRPAPF